jgi:glycerol-3-phosphate acyltransferase PlsY
VATTVGVALGIWPAFTISMVVALLIYALARFTTGLVSVGSLAIAVAFPATFFAYVQLTGLPLRTCWPLQTAAILLGLLIILRHRENIQRLLLRQEMPLDDKPHGD